MLILGLLSMYFDAAVVFFTMASLFFKMAVTVLCRTLLCMASLSTAFEDIHFSISFKKYHCTLILYYKVCIETCRYTVFWSLYVIITHIHCFQNTLIFLVPKISAVRGLNIHKKWKQEKNNWLKHIFLDLGGN